MRKVFTIVKEKLMMMLVTCVVLSPGVAVAQDAMLTLISGNTVIELSEADYLALPQNDLMTENEWYDGMVTYTGPSAMTILDMLPHEGATSVVLTSMDDYAVEVPIEDFENYGVVLAHSLDGERLSRRGKGPIWVMYPLSDFAELQDPIYNSRLIWQLKRFEVK